MVMGASIVGTDPSSKNNPAVPARINSSDVRL